MKKHRPGDSEETQTRRQMCGWAGVPGSVRVSVEAWAPNPRSCETAAGPAPQEVKASTSRGFLNRFDVFKERQTTRQ
ncbi:hypothetical protein LZ30DRAFT_445067 [Colletotrichum cereale]|nr:hypothetical protein LZ30DRAFT_445067 [Colletotrichum cereale]